MKNILLCGVGGQGTVLASKLIAACAMRRGDTAHTAETIGMAQRGGSVVSHVRIGENAFSPLIPKGNADMIISFEPAEAVRSLPYLRRGGTVIVSSAAVKPASDSLSDSSYDGGEMLAYLREQGIRTLVVDGAAITDALGNAKSLNIALLGAAASSSDAGFSEAELESVISETLKPQFREQNLRALALGKQHCTKLA